MCKFTNTDVVFLQTCILLAIEEPYDLDRGFEYGTIEQDTQFKQERGEVADVDNNRKKYKNYITMLSSNSPSLKGA